MRGTISASWAATKCCTSAVASLPSSQVSDTSTQPRLALPKCPHLLPVPFLISRLSHCPANPIFPACLPKASCAQCTGPSARGSLLAVSSHQLPIPISPSYSWLWRDKTKAKSTTTPSFLTSQRSQRSYQPRGTRVFWGGWQKARNEVPAAPYWVLGDPRHPKWAQWSPPRPAPYAGPRSRRALAGVGEQKGGELFYCITPYNVFIHLHLQPPSHQHPLYQHPPPRAASPKTTPAWRLRIQVAHLQGGRGQERGSGPPKRGESCRHFGIAEGGKSLELYQRWISGSVQLGGLKPQHFIPYRKG